MPHAWRRRSIPEENSATHLLYYENAYLRQFEAKVVKIEQFDNLQAVILNQTAFYPLGGGQPADNGVLKGEGWEARVVDVRWRDDVPLHLLSDIKNAPKEHDRVVGVIDWDRRWALMRNHTTAHLISEAINQAVGQPVAIVGSAVNVDKSRLDLRHEGSLRELFAKIEEISNAVVKEDRLVTAKIMPRREAEEYLERFHESLKTLPSRIESIRVVEIKDWHACACGGTHVKSTGELGVIKIVGRAAKGKGVERIEFVAQNP